MFNHGIVAGKFWPLHRGHDYLIKTALARCERVTIFVVKSANEVPSADIRAQWVRAAYPTANVKVIANLFMDDSTEESNVYWAEYTRQILHNDPIDVVFSSEDYADGWAKHLGAQHVKVDSAREMFAVSGTMIRQDPMAFWHLIHKEAQPFYVKRVLFVGAESVGKSTMTRNLSRKYGTLFVPEYGRIYVERHGITDMTKKIIFSEIVNNQLALEEEMAKEAHRLLFVDTDLYTTLCWYQLWGSDDSYDPMLRLIYEESLQHSPYDLVFVLDDKDTKWVNDGYRDQEKTRGWFTQRFMHNDFYSNPILLSGPIEEREAKAIKVINETFFKGSQAVVPS